MAYTEEQFLAVQRAPRKLQAEFETGYYMDILTPSGELIAWDREEDDYCERGTFACSVHHTRDSSCQTW